MSTSGARIRKQLNIRAKAEASRKVVGYADTSAVAAQIGMKLRPDSELRQRGTIGCAVTTGQDAASVPAPYPLLPHACGHGDHEPSPALPPAEH